MATPYTFTVASDLRKYGTTEDGEDYFAEVYYVMATDALGNRFVHNKTFDCCLTEDGEEWTIFNNVSEQAIIEVDALLAKIQQAAPVELDPRYWIGSYAAYGSAAYSDKDAVAWEVAREY
jgi:hypothetical protein